MTVSRKAILIAAAILLGAAIVYVNLTFERATGPEVQVEAVERRHLEAVVSAPGTIVPQLTVDISADKMGRVTRLVFDEGDRVDAGDFLLEIDPETLRAAVDGGEAALQASRSSQQQAEVAVETARVNLELARDDLERQEHLWGLRLISRQDYDRALNEVALRETDLRAREVEVATQVQRIRQQEASLQSARYDLTKVTITSPISGVVTRRNIEEGETVVVGTMNNPGTVLATIADLSVIEAEVEVDETDIPGVELGQTATVTIDAFPDRDFSGVVTEIGNSPMQQDGPTGGAGTQATVFKVVVTLDEAIPGVRPGFTCTADITTAVRSDSLAIPIQAATVREVALDADGNVVRRETGSRRRGVTGISAAEAAEAPSEETEEELEGVFVAREGRAVFAPVDTGIAGERYFEALSGVTEGDLIIIGPFNEVRNLADGDSIRVVDSATRR